MKTIFKFLFISTAFFGITSCEDVVQIKLDEGSKLYVIDAFVNNTRSNQTIRVLTNDNYFSNREAPPVTNATVILKDLTANKQYNFNYTSKGNYVFALATTDTISKIGHQYELNVIVDGNTYTSICLQKRTAILDSISAVYNDGTSGFGPPNPSYNCFLWARDKVDLVPDYYWIKTFKNDTLFDKPSDLNTAIDGTGGEVTNAGGADTLDFTPPAIFLGFNSYKSGDKCKVEIHSISRETNNFLFQAVAQIQNGGLFATTPENVRTNITTPSGAKTKAVGWFNMATVVSKTKLIP
ncbi:MAG: DUF4249 family protein [Bacteroidota bacterium]|nr:DUF4249 family protein [Bacteroidota bacterium]MDP3144495.1 DUF4249 family protein [Bacteroidota bacterium]MDP3555824.1 DUF4249 family protein [Bacteroidota bacterium]